MVYPHNGKLLHNTGAAKQMKPCKHHTRWKKPVTKDYTVSDPTSMEMSGRINLPRLEEVRDCLRGEMGDDS